MKKFLKNVATLAAAAGACMLVFKYFKKKQDDTITVDAEDITDADDSVEEVTECAEECEAKAECDCEKQEECTCEEKAEEC